MKLHRFFINQKIEESPSIEITDIELVHQLKNVLRVKIGDKFILLDNAGIEAVVRTEEIMKKSLIFSKEKLKKFSRKNEVLLALYPAVLKKDKMEYVLQKCTEIGVLEFCPIVSDRTEKINLNMKRLDKITREAAEQSEKIYLPHLCDVRVLTELFTEHETNGEFYYLDMDAPMIDVSQIIENSKNNSDDNPENRISILIGPEGGWSDVDRKLFNEHGVKPLSLGKTVLRAETAPIAVSSLFLLGRK
jgi:16S rRNA (uracil1498-N3)-methyltransferase